MTDARGPKTIDLAERAQLLKTLVFFTGPCFIMLGALWFFFYEKGVISGGLMIVLMILDLPLAVGGAFAINALVGHGSRGFVNTMLAWGGTAPQGPPSYPRQETLIIRGQYAEAAEYFRDHIRVSPEDLYARLKLAELLERHMKDDVGAEKLYNEVRRLATDRYQEHAATNALIDLYRRGKRTARLRVELGRYVEKYKGSPAADAAARELRDLKGEAADTAGAT